MAILSYKCPGCGGRLDFNPELQKCKCPYCLSTFTAEEIEAQAAKDAQTDAPAAEAPPTPEPGAASTDGEDIDRNTRVYSCPSCGAQVIADLVTAATFCCYCHNPVVVSEQLSGAFRPSMIIPFKLTRESAIDKLREWCGKKKLLPGDFLSARQLDKVTGIYIPYWLTDCDLHGSMRAEGRQTSTWRDSDYIYTKTDIYDCARQADLSFKLVPHDASGKADDRVMESIEPFDYKGIKDFAMSYLTGFFAEKYDKDQNLIEKVVQERVRQVSRGVLRDSIRGYSSVMERGSDFQFKHIKSHYALLPIWMMTYIYRGATYMYAVNGQTGKVFGILPVSRGKLGILFGAVTLGVFALCFLGGLLL